MDELRILPMALVCGLLSVVPARGQTQTTLLNENFNELTPAPVGPLDVGAFALTFGFTSVLGPGNNPQLCAPPTSGNCVELGGGPLSLGVSSELTAPNPLTETAFGFPLKPGVDYFLSFDLVGNGSGPSSTMVQLGPFSETFNLGPNNTTSGVVTNHLITVNAPTGAFLFFRNTTANTGAILDNVVLTCGPGCPIPTPEPGTLALFAVGLAGLVVTRRRWT